MTAKIPATVVTGFLGAGETTLLNRYLATRPERKVAVLENEYGSVGIDGGLIAGSPAVEVVELTDHTLAQVEQGKARSQLSRLAGIWERSELDELSGWLAEGVIPRVDVLKAAHHGARNGVTPGLIATDINKGLIPEDKMKTILEGIPLNRIWVIVGSVAGFVALVAGIIWGSKLGVQFSLSLVALKALPVLILGGFTSVPGAIVGGLIVGAGEKLAEVYLGPFIGGGIENWFPYMLALVFLLVRPEGLFGERHIERV